MTWPKGYNPPQSKDKTSYDNGYEQVVCKNCNKSNHQTQDSVINAESNFLSYVIIVEILVISMMRLFAINVGQNYLPKLK